MKRLIWIGSSREDLKSFPRAVQKILGVALMVVQFGKMPERAKPLMGLPGVYEVRSDYKTGTFRAVYTVKLGAQIYVLHAFQKKSKSGIATPKPDIDLIRRRLSMAKRLAKEMEQ